MKAIFYVPVLAMFLLTGCIGDDIIFDTVDETVRITNPIDSLLLGDTYTFEARFFNNIGQVESRPVIWSSSDPTIVSVDDEGTVTGLELGEAIITATVDLDDSESVTDQLPVVVNTESTNSNITERLGTLRTTSSYVLEGTFLLTETSSGLLLDLADDYRASSSLPGLYLYLTNNANTINGAFEVGEVTTFAGAHTYELPSEVELNEYKYLLYYCKPFGVKSR